MGLSPVGTTALFLGKIVSDLTILAEKTPHMNGLRIPKNSQKWDSLGEKNASPQCSPIPAPVSKYQPVLNVFDV